MIAEQLKKLSFLSYFSIVATIFLTTVLLEFFTVTIQTKLMVGEAQERAIENTVGLAKIIVNPTLEKDYSQIIDIFNAILENKKIVSVSLLDRQGISKITVWQNGKMSFDANKYNIATPNEYDEKEYLITSLAKISDTNYLRIQTSIEATKNIASSIMMNAIVIAVLLALMAIIINIFLLKKPLKELDSLSAYAANLPTHYGMQAPSATSTLELRTLSNALNEASHVLYEQTTELEAANTELVALNESLEERVRHQTEQILSHERLLVQQSKMAAMGDMIGAIAHQWRQPLNALAITVQDIEFAYKFGEVDEAYIARTVKESMSNIEFMSKTIDDFRNFFKPAKDKSEFAASFVIQSIISIVSSQLKNSDINLIVDGDDFKIFGYSSELSQVLLNLVSNAKDAILEQNAPSDRWIRITTTKDGFITVCDSGGGINEEILEHIYEPYFTTKEQGKGTGIGLYMSKLIVEKHMGGFLGVSNGEHGACFKIKLTPAL